MIYVILYLIAIVLANLTVAWFGSATVIINAFLFIGFDLTIRDKLHDTWQGKNLKRNMFLLIISGSIISWLLNRNAATIASASFVAFTVSSLADATVYQLLLSKPKLSRINFSNLVGALVDSVVFPTLAFGVFVPQIIIGQFLAKTIGGFVWSLLITKVTENPFYNNEKQKQA